MLQLEGVFATDRLTRYNTVFTPGALAGGLVQTFAAGLPSLVSHDNSRPFGWTTPRVLFFEPHFTRLCGVTEVPETREEQTRLRDAMMEFWAHRAQARAGEVAILRSAAGDAGSGAEVLLNECVSLYEPGIAKRLFPEVFVEDDDGLVDLSSLDQLAPGVYRVSRRRDLVIYAHHFLRRSSSPLNSLNTPLLEQLHDLSAKGMRPRVALDPDMVGLADSYKPVLEHQYWWGPLFSHDLVSIPAGVTVHAATDRERFYHGVLRTEFFWYSRKGQKILEVEEVRDMESAAPARESGQVPTPFGCRYAHAIVNEATGQLIHFDGAVRLYSEEQMLERHDLHIDVAGRDKTYRKLWRVDAPISVEAWKRLLSDYFRDNHLVGEYLGAPQGALESDFEAPANDQAVGDLREDLPGTSKPAQAPSASSVRSPRAAIAIVMMPPQKGPRAIRPEVVLLQKASPPTHHHECEAVEIAKLIRRSDESLEFASGETCIAFEDTYHNIPCIWHESSDAIPATVSALRTLAVAMNGAGSEISGGSHAVAFSIGVRIPSGTGDENGGSSLPPDAALLLSFKGEAADVARILGEWPSSLQPALGEKKMVPAIADAIAKTLEAWQPTHDSFATLRAVIRAKSVRFSRQYLGTDEWQVEHHSGGHRIVANVDLARRPQLSAEDARNNLVPAPALLITKVRCSLCRGSYATCAHVRTVDPGCHVKVLDYEYVGAFLTDRPAWDPNEPASVQPAATVN